MVAAYVRGVRRSPIEFGHLDRGLARRFVERRRPECLDCWSEGGQFQHCAVNRVDT